LASVTRNARPNAASTGLPAVRELALNVSDLDRSVAFFRGLDFVPTDELYLSGPELEVLVGLPAAEMRVARLRLGSERVELRHLISNRVPAGQCRCKPAVSACRGNRST
jgi:hypothetical protein